MSYETRRGRPMRAFYRFFLVLPFAGLFVWGCVSTLTQEQLEETYGTHPPVIDRYGAAQRVSAGRTWRLYLAAHDPDGDMDRVEFELDRPGQVVREHRKELNSESAGSFSGYFYLNIPMVSALRGQELLGTSLTMQCELIDKAGHRSKEVTLPFQVVLSPVSQPVPENFTDRDVRNLGPVVIRFELENWWGRPFEKD